MSKQLLDNLNEIKNQKDTYLLPENLKKGATCLGVTGTLESNDLSDYFNLEPPNLIDGYSYSFNDLILKIPDNLDLSQTKDISSFFEGLSSIKHIPMLDITKFTNTSQMFYECHNLIDIPQLDTSNVEDMSLMFQGCWRLETVPLLDTSNAKNMSHIFQECRSLKNIPAFNTSKNTDFTLFIGIAEGTEGSLIEFPSIDTSKGKKFWHMCYKQRSLVTVPVLDLSGVTTISNNLDGMFGFCTSLSDDSLNNIMASLATVADTGTTNKTLQNVGLSSEQANKCKTLSNYSAFTAAGWTTGY